MFAFRWKTQRGNSLAARNSVNVIPIQSYRSIGETCENCSRDSSAELVAKHESMERPRQWKTKQQTRQPLSPQLLTRLRQKRPSIKIGVFFSFHLNWNGRSRSEFTILTWFESVQLILPFHVCCRELKWKNENKNG